MLRDLILVVATRTGNKFLQKESDMNVIGRDMLVFAETYDKGKSKDNRMQERCLTQAYTQQKFWKILEAKLQNANNIEDKVR